MDRVKGLRLPLDPGDAGTKRTLDVMRRLADRASTSSDVVRKAQDLIRWTPARDTRAMATAIDSWVRSHVRFTHDPVTVEVVADPALMLRDIEEHGLATGDCDDHVTLLAALLGAVGIDTQFVVLSQMPSDENGRPADYGHVLLAYWDPKGGWVTVDPITNKPHGWFPTGSTRVAVHAPSSMAGLPMQVGTAPAPRTQRGPKARVGVPNALIVAGAFFLGVLVGRRCCR